jgi:putative transposase
MASENPLWGEERIANELLVKLGIRMSPRTVSKYMPKRPPGRPRGDQRWSTFLKNHAKAILACDFFVAVTAAFRILYVFVVIEHSTRRLAHINVTTNPNADWTLQQLREVMGNGGGHRYLIHDRDRISPSTSTIRSEPWESRHGDRRWRVRKRIRFASASSAQRDVNA